MSSLPNVFRIHPLLILICASRAILFFTFFVVFLFILPRPVLAQYPYDPPCASGDCCWGTPEPSCRCYPCCTDSDGGLDYYTWGEVDVYPPGFPHVLVRDTCQADNITLLEWYCDFGVPEAQHVFYTCPNGCDRDNRVCIGCVPNCAGKDCGDDGCGGSCGSCGSGETCVDGQCETESDPLLGTCPEECTSRGFDSGTCAFCDMDADPLCNPCGSDTLVRGDFGCIFPLTVLGWGSVGCCCAGGQVCGNGIVEGTEGCDPPGSTGSCTMANGCPGQRTCNSSCEWGSCSTNCASGSCPHTECTSGCPWPGCSDVYTCGWDSCSTDCDCGVCSPGDLTSCDSCQVGNCPGRRQCTIGCCWGSCQRSGDSYCCPSGETCPYYDCYGGNCENREDRVCGADACNSNNDCRHCGCDESSCGAYCDWNCNCTEETCRVYYDNVADVSDECGSIYLGCNLANATCCEPSCNSPYCGQDNGCGDNCSYCDASDDYPWTTPTVLSSPINLNPGSGSSSLPERVHTSRSAVLNSSPLSTTLWWNDDDVGNGCGGSSRSDEFPIRIDDLDNGWSGNCSALNLGDECGSPSGTSYPFSAVIGDRYNWWVHARNETCISYDDCCGGSYSGEDDWTDEVDGGYICRPDCRPTLCGQNDGCGGTTLVGFNGFWDTQDDDCYWDENGDPSSPVSPQVSLDGVSYDSSSNVIDPVLFDPPGDDSTSQMIYFRWWINDARARGADDALQIQIWDVGDPVDVNPADFDWGAPGTPGTLVQNQTYDYNGLCSSGVCETSFSASYHRIYAWRVAHHNVTCETIDVSTNVGTVQGQVDTLDDEDGDGNPDCANSNLCTGDGSRDWSGWAAGYFTLNNAPRVISISPTCATRAAEGRECWSGHPSYNPENDQSVWPWDDDWMAPSDDPIDYCTNHGCEDIDLQNNPVVYEVIYEDPDGWEDLRRFGFTLTDRADCGSIGSGHGGYVYLERADYYSACPSSPCPDPGSGECSDVVEVDNFTGMNLDDYKVERVSGSGCEDQLRGFFKVRFEDSLMFGELGGGEVKLCGYAWDFHMADGAYVSWAGVGDWNWYVDLERPHLDAESTDPVRGNEMTDLFEVDADGDGTDDTWAFEVKLALKDFEVLGEESLLLEDQTSAKLTSDVNGDGVVTFDERVADDEENELSILAWYYNDYDGAGGQDCIRLPAEVDAGSYPFYYRTEPADFDGDLGVVVTLYVPAENEPDPIGGIHYQRTEGIRVQIKDGGGTVYDSGSNLTLYPGWFQVINGDVYSRSDISVGIDEAIDEALYDGYFLASDPYPPGDFTPDTSGGIVLSASSIDNENRTSERPDGLLPDWGAQDYSSPTRLEDWNEALGFDWGAISTWDPPAAFTSWNSLDPGEIYKFTGNLQVSGSYNLSGDGVAIVYVDGDLEIGDGSSPGVNAMFRSNNSERKGIIFVVEGGVTVRENIIRIDAFIIANDFFTGDDYSIIIELANADSALTVNGGLVGREGVDVSRYSLGGGFTVYNAVLQTRFNPLYLAPGHNLPVLRSSRHSWEESE